MGFALNIVDTTTGKEVATYDVPDSAVLALKDKLQGEAGVLEWIKNAIAGKVHNCRKNMRSEWAQKLIDEEILPPKNDDDFIALVVARPDYKDRETREAEEAARHEQLARTDSA